MPTRPTTSPLWCTSNPTNRANPPSSEVATGFAAGEPLPAQYLNGLVGNHGDWLAYLAEQGSGTQLATTLDFSTRLIGGGQWSWSGTTLSWASTAYIAIPSGPDANNTLAAGSVSIPVGSVAYVTANEPFSTTGTTASGSTQLTNLLYGDLVQVGQAVSGAGIAAGTTVQAVGSDGASATLSQAATASGSGVTLTFSSSGTLTAQVSDTAALVPGPNTVVFARAVEDMCIVGVGSGQMVLRQLEAKTLLSNGYVVTHRLPAGMALPAGSAVYVSQGASDYITAYRRPQAGSTFVAYVTQFTTGAVTTGGINVGDVLVGGGIPAGTTVTAFDPSSGTVTPSQAISATTADTGSAASVRIQRTSGALYVASAGQSGLTPTPPQRAQVAGIAPSGAAAGAQARLVVSGSVYSLSGLTPGAVHFLSASTPGALTATPPVGAGQSVVPVGLAMSATALLLNPAAAEQATVVTNPAYKSLIRAGTFALGSASTSQGYTTYDTSVDYNSNALARFPVVLPMPHAGSITGLSLFSAGTAGGSVTVTPYITNVAQSSGASQLSVASGARPTVNFAKGSLPFVAGDQLSFLLNFTTAGAQQLSLNVEVELTP